MINILKKQNGMNIIGQGGKIILSVFLYAGVIIFIGKEERQLTKAFGKKYEDYLLRVDRLVPFKKP